MSNTMPNPWAAPAPAGSKNRAPPLEPVLTTIWPFVTLNVGTIRGGVASNVVPDRCAIELGARLLPGMETEPLVARIRAAVGDAVDDAPWTIDVVTDSPPADLDERSDLWEWLVSESARPGSAPSIPFATDAGWLQRLGFECVIWGPGSIETAHRADEHVPVADLARGREILARAVTRWCRG